MGSNEGNYLRADVGEGDHVEYCQAADKKSHGQSMPGTHLASGRRPATGHPLELGHGRSRGKGSTPSEYLNCSSHSTTRTYTGSTILIYNIILIYKYT